MDPIEDDTSELMRPEEVEGFAMLDESGTWRAESLAAELTRSWARVWVRRGGSGEPLAYVATWLVQDELHVLNVVTSKHERRRGHARVLLTRALDFARSRKVRLVLLEVRRSNAPAIALYRGFGFAAVNVRARYYDDGEDAVEMLLEFDLETGQRVARADEIELE